MVIEHPEPGAQRPTADAGVQRRRELGQRLRQVQARVGAACSAAGRDVGDVTLIVVTKFFPSTDLATLAQLGVTDIGESRDQEARAKLEELGHLGELQAADRRDRDAKPLRSALRIHMVGQVQRKKARSVARYADVVHSVDRAALVSALDRATGSALQAGERAERLRVLVQVDLESGNPANAGNGAGAGPGTESAPAARGGAAPGDVSVLTDQIAACAHLELAGLMAVAPRGLDQDERRAAFTRLAELSAQVRLDHPGASMMSAGMSADLEEAVAAGATHLRVGSAILGTRPPAR